MLIAAIVLCVALLLFGSPIFVSLSIAGLIVLLLHLGMPFEGIGQIFYHSVYSYPLLAVPFFILAGTLMGEMGVVAAIVRFMNALLGRIRGALGLSLVGSCAFFGAMSGSNVAAVTTLSIAMGPVMEEHGYPRKYLCGVLSTSGSIGTMIPPTINGILFGFVAEMSVGKLFMSSLLPGLLLTVLCSLGAIIVAARRRYGTPMSVGWVECLKTFIYVLPALSLPIAIVVPIYTGILIPTECGALACLLALIVGLTFYKRLSVSQVLSVVRKGMLQTANIYLLIAGASLMGHVLIAMKVPHGFSQLMIRYGVGYWSFMGICMLIFLVAGMFLDPSPQILVIVPILLPTVFALGVDPYVFYILQNCFVSLGQITPPVALVLYILSGLNDVDIGTILRESWPFVLALVLVVVITWLFPPLANFLPAQMGR